MTESSPWHISRRSRRRNNSFSSPWVDSPTAIPMPNGGGFGNTPPVFDPVPIENLPSWPTASPAPTTPAPPPAPTYSPYPNMNEGGFHSPMTGYTPYVPQAATTNAAGWRQSLGDDGQTAYNEAMRQLRADQARPPDFGSDAEYKEWNAGMVDRQNDIERSYEQAQKDYNTAWNEYVAMRSSSLLPFLGDQDRSYLQSVMNAAVPNAPQATATPSDGTRAADRNLYSLDRMRALRRGMEWGSQFFSGEADPDPRAVDRLEQNQQYLNEAMGIAERTAGRDTEHDLRRYQVQQRGNDWNTLNAAYAEQVDPRIQALANSIVNPSGSGQTMSPMAQQLGARTSATGNNQGRRAGDWAWRNMTLT